MSIEMGNKIFGKVTGITKFGAFVDLGEGKNGLVHISEISEGYVKDINDVLETGQVVEVLVTNIAEDGKIALSIRRVNSDGSVEEHKPNRPGNDSRREQNSDNRASRPAKSYQDQKAPKTSNRPSFNKPSQSGFSNSNYGKTNDFDSLMSDFLKDSDDRLTSLKRNTEGKRGGRGGRRN